MKPLSFLIITYNRPGDMLELARNITLLDKAEELLEEIIVINNCSTENYEDAEEFMLRSSLPFRYSIAPENLGVARGRNYALAQGTAPLVIMLDDDAVLQNKNCLVNLVDEFSRPDTTRPKAIISFRVLYYDTLEMQKNALPHKRFSEFRDKAFFETYYYAGGAHAIRRDVIERLGAYPAGFFYGMEEYDLSFRILDAGYSIVYSDRITMLHKESPLGRKPKKEKIRMMWVNKSIVAYRYLPTRYFLSTAFMWSLFYLRSTGFNLSGFFKGWNAVSKIRNNEKKQLISKQTLTYLRSLDARLAY
ncbi:MAG: glycosyltransferase family 2 protein [Chitinophagaceae bacterium]|nr:MAG: glycosyltransferase family 2 protein [Chitinophagaceae bacterium]